MHAGRRSRGLRSGPRIGFGRVPARSACTGSGQPAARTTPSAAASSSSGGAVASSHVVRGSGFQDCGRAHYFPLFGGSTDVIRRKLGVDEKASVRDHMNLAQLAAVSLSEALSVEHIEKERVYGNNACVEVCNKVGREVAKLRPNNSERCHGEDPPARRPELPVSAALRRSCEREKRRSTDRCPDGDRSTRRPARGKEWLHKRTG